MNASETLEISGLRFEVRRSRRRKTLSLTVDRGGELVVHAPEKANPHELEKWARSKLLWVYRKLALKAQMFPRVREPEFVSGESFSYLGRSYRLMTVGKQKEPLCFDGRRFLLRKDARRSGNESFRKWYVAVGENWIAKRVEILAPKAGASPSGIALRDLGFRWGSCGKHGVVYFNWKLLQLPTRLTDYVIAHELAHLREPHHRDEFWRLLDQSLPDWRNRREELKLKSSEIYWCHRAMTQ